MTRNTTIENASTIPRIHTSAPHLPRRPKRSKKGKKKGRSKSPRPNNNGDKPPPSTTTSDDKPVNDENDEKMSFNFSDYNPTETGGQRTPMRKDPYRSPVKEGERDEKARRGWEGLTGLGRLG